MKLPYGYMPGSPIMFTEFTLKIYFELLEYRILLRNFRRLQKLKRIYKLMSYAYAICLLIRVWPFPFFFPYDNVMAIRRTCRSVCNLGNA